jgi:maltodextrin utilization protein YvdJ
MLQNTRAATGGNPNSPDGEPHGDENDALQQKLQDQLRQAQIEADQFTKNDQTIKRKDTVEVVVDILNRIKATADEVN